MAGYTASMAAAKKRIGLILASIHTGASQNVWSSFAKIARAESAAFFIFPGGRLNARTDSEYLRNSVYSLANQENLDGLISWGSTIGYTGSPEEFEHFHAGFGPLPYVTLAYKIPGHPCVEFDAYNGMKTLVAHFIRVHHARKIAFIRGPNFHQSADARFRGYRDALLEAGLPAELNSPLVSEPFNWNRGDEAAAQLFAKRGLAPGRDFDTLIGSSDMMVFGAVNYLRKKGYHIPIDYHAGGFNNSSESRILESPLSTVHMPYAELSGESFRILLKLLKRKKGAPIEDIRLPSEVIIRESCGCRNSFHTGGKKAPGPQTGIEGSIVALLSMAARALKLNPQGTKVLLSPVIRAFFYEEEKRFFHLFEKALVRFFNSNQDPEVLIDLVDAIFSSGLIPEDTLLRVSPPVYSTVFRIQERLGIRARHEAEKWNSALNSLKCELLGTRDRSGLVRSLARYLPDIGIATGSIVLYEDEKISVWVGSFSPQGIGPLREQRFPSKLLVPDQVKDQYADGIFMVQPLFIENQSLGYFIHSVPFYDGLIFEELRSAVSYALKGIALMNEVIRAGKIAEQAERAKTEFLQLLENELYDPLSGMMETIESLEKKIPPGHEGAAQDVQDLKALIASRNAETGSLIDLILSRIDRLPISKRLFDPEELLPGIGAFPLVTGDMSRLSQGVSLIRDVYGGDFSAGLEQGGLSVAFHAAAPQPAGGRKKQGLLLAERILLLHGGTCVWDDSVCRITLPWTTLTGQDPLYRAGNLRDQVLALSDPSLRPANFFDLKAVQDIEQAAALPGRIACIFWDTDAASAKDMVKVSALRRRPEFLRIPFLCYGKGLFRGASFSEKTLIDAVEQAVKTPKTEILLFIGVPEELRKTWASCIRGGIDEIHIASISAFNETVAEIVPSLIVLNSINPETVEPARRHPLTVTVPIVIISDRIRSTAEVLTLCRYSRVLLCHTGVASSPEFMSRIRALLEGDEMLPPHTAGLVKKTLLYFDGHTAAHISRWKLAESVHASEDYLTRIFHREMGLSLWDYLNRYRVFFAAGLLRQTDDAIQEIALRSGFQDQAYFCRVFRKLYGLPPGKLRKCRGAE
ncbi:MAG: helix-turn-helix domain-containing protein [Treponema sp.]|nr:helix-turn-helix domain-containing protein [Treponema sp.]